MYTPRIDWETPTWGDLIARSAEESAYPELWPDHAWVPALGPTGNVLHDLCGGLSATKAGSPTWGPDYVEILNGTNDYYDAGLLNLSDLEHFSVFAKVRRLTQDSIDPIASNFQYNTASFEFRFDNSNRIDFGYYSAGGYSQARSTGSRFYAGIYTVAATCGIGSPTRVYVDGVVDDEETGTIGAFRSDNATYHFRLGDSERYPGNLDGHLYCALIYRKTLSNSQVAQLHADPYCWLRVRQDVLWRVPSGVIGVPNVFNMGCILGKSLFKDGGML